MATLSNQKQRALKSVLDLSSTDPAFRARLLADPRSAIASEFGIVVPENFRVKFIEREPEVDALIVLPDPQRPDGELSDRELDVVAGGGGKDEAPWSDGSGD
jgi:hypothetical protein